MSHQVAIVTGANRGIGLEICRQLAQKNIQVVLTSRSLAKAQLAIDSLQTEGQGIRAMELDVADADSIQKFASQFEQEFGRLDILVNNAGVLLDVQRKQTSVFDANTNTIQETMQTNVYGPLQLIQAFVPLMQKNQYGRIVNVSSGMGQISDMGGGHTAYRLSKVSLNALTKIVHAELKHPNIKINTMCPGWVKTDMGGPNATRSVAQGADTAVWLATLADDGPSGLFFRDRQKIDW